ncbi:hypothetical protein ABZP36_021723 [Zizania latifolia]
MGPLANRTWDRNSIQSARARCSPSSAVPAANLPGIHLFQCSVEQSGRLFVQGAE